MLLQFTRYERKNQPVFFVLAFQAAAELTFPEPGMLFGKSKHIRNKIDTVYYLLVTNLVTKTLYSWIRNRNRAILFRSPEQIRSNIQEGGRRQCTALENGFFTWQKWWKRKMAWERHVRRPVLSGWCSGRRPQGKSATRSARRWFRKAVSHAGFPL